MTIRNGQLHLLQISEKEEPLTLDWENIHATISELSSEGPSEVRLSALIPDPQPSSNLTLNGTITLLEQDDPSPHQENPSGFPALEVRGQLEVSQFHLGRLVQFLRGHALEKPIPTRATLQGNVSYTFQQEQ